MGAHLTRSILQLDVLQGFIFMHVSTGVKIEEQVLQEMQPLGLFWLQKLAVMMFQGNVLIEIYLLYIYEFLSQPLDMENCILRGMGFKYNQHVHFCC
jgi:hypothetical protein